MAKKQKQWARMQRLRLIHILGGRCAACGTDEALTFDCIESRGDAHHRGSTDQRICFYRREMQAGNVQLLCHSCNALKADLSKHMWTAAVQMAWLRARRLIPRHSPGQGAERSGQQFRMHLSDIINAYAEVSEPF